MTSPGTNIGNVYYSIKPDVDTIAFARSGATASAAFSRAFSSSVSAASKSFSGLASGATGAISSINSGLSSIGTAAWRGANHASDAMRSLSSHIGIMSFQLQIMGGMLTALVTGPLITAGVGLASWGIKTAMNIEDATVAMRALLPAGYDVESLIERLKTLAISSPVFAVDALFDFTRKLVGAGLEASKAEVLLDSLNNIFITYGVTGEKASKALLGVSQVFSKGKVTSEELTQQIGEQIPIWYLLSQASGKSQAELREMSKEGTFTADMFAAMLTQAGALPSVMEGSAAGVHTLSAQWAILKEGFQQTLATKILEFFPQIKQALADLTPLLAELLGIIVSKIPAAIEWVTKLVDQILRIRDIYNELNPVQQEWIDKIVKFIPIAGPALLILGAMATALSSILGVISMLLNPWGLLFAAVIGGAIALYAKFQEVRDVVKGFVNAVWTGFKENVWPALQQIWAIVEEKLIPAYTKLIKALGFDSWKEFGAFLGGALIGAIKTVIDVVGFLINIWSTIITDLAAIVSGFKAAWQWIKDFGSAAWEFIQGAGKAIGSFFVNLWDDVAGAFTSAGLKIGGFFAGIWHNITDGIKTAWNKVKEFFAILIGSIKEYISDQMDKAVGQAIIHTFNQIKSVLGPFFDWLVNAAKVVFDFLRSTISGAFDGAASVLRWFRDSVIGPVFDALSAAVGWLGDRFVWVKDNVIKPVFDAIGGALGWLADQFVWFRDHVISPIWDGIGDKIKSVVEWIGSMWDWLKDKLKAPINVIIGFINRGVIDNWNWLAGYVPFMPTLGHIPELAGGGKVNGPGTSTSDSILARLSRGEFVMNAKAVDFWGAGLLSAMNAVGPMQSFAGGGMASLAVTTAPKIPAISGPAGSGGAGGIAVTVYLGDELLMDKVQAKIDQNNQAVIRLSRAARSTY